MTDYLEKIVYQRKGTKVIIPETVANKADPNLIPITVGMAIDLGYITDPKGRDKSSVNTSLLEDENARLKRQIEELMSKNEETPVQINVTPNEVAPKPRKKTNKDPSPVAQQLNNPSVNDEGHDETDEQLKLLLGT